MEQTLKYTVEGTGQGGHTWSVCGDIVSNAGWPDCTTDVLCDAFQALTQGKAEFGNPGQGGCRGPYQITKFLVEVA